jgi:hypothetical protein
MANPRSQGRRRTSPGSLVPPRLVPPRPGRSAPSASLAPTPSGSTSTPAGSPTATSGCCSATADGEPEAGRVLVVGPAALLHPHIPQPAGSLVFELLTGHPERQPHELVFLADLTGELRAWPHAIWAAVGVDPAAVTGTVIACWWAGEVQGLAFEGVSFEEARALERPAMTIVRGQLRARLTGRVHRAYWRWLHPTSGRRPGDTFL